MEIQKYPVGRQDFKKIITENFVYVDKTRYVHTLVSQGGYYFLSRPRRFGKSLLISTLYYLFKGEKALFEGLFIADKWAFEEYPVIRISFANSGYREIGLERAINGVLEENAAEYGLVLQATSSSLKFNELIRALNNRFQQQVVILIDEYDKPIIDYLDKDQLPKARENRGILKSFYSILKDADPYLKLVFITGVSKFTQVSIFSDLNNLYDLTVSRDYNEICGISQAELEQYFPQELVAFDREKIRQWYNGYRWDIDGSTVYNPFSLLSFFGGGGKFQNFWFNTGTPTFLVEMSKAQQMYDLDQVSANSLLLSNFDIDHLEPIPVLFQTGYLTIQSYQDQFDRYTLGYPNEEVKASFIQYLGRTYMHGTISQAFNTPFDMLEALQQKKSDKLQGAINHAFEHIPGPLWQKDNEQFYHAIIHLLFSLLGVYIHSEVHTKEGRADALINIDEGIFCLEFKLDKSAEEAIAQIHEKGYLKAFLNKGKPCHAIGINFSKEKKVVEKILWEEVS
jgi:hypothetical protein